MNTQLNSEKFKDMDYETAVTELKRLIGILERSEGTFDELMQVYKDAFEYYTYCAQYLSVAAEKIKELNSFLSGFAQNQEGV